MSYQFIEVTTQDQLEKVFAFRYEIVCEKLGVSELEGCEPNRETDEYDAYSDHYAAFDEEGEVIACTRLIHHSPIGYPTTNNMSYDSDIWQFEQEKLGEFSRIFVSPKIRSIQQLRPLFDSLKVVGYSKIEEHGIAYTLGALEKSFFRLLGMLQFPYKRIGDLQSYITPRYPCIMYTDEAVAINPELFGNSTIK